MKAHNFFVLSLMSMLSISTAGCRKSGNNNNKNPDEPEVNFVKGKALDAQGNALSSVKIIVSNAVFYDAHVTGETNSEGFYRIRIPGVAGASWRVYAEIKKDYNGKRYKFDLHPETTATFSAETGAVRNFTWRLTGEKPEPLAGIYGGLVRLTHESNENNPIYDLENVLLTLTPVGPLVDGSTGSVLQKRASAITKDFEVPVGRYIVSAVYAPNGQQPVGVKVRLLDTGNYSNSVTIDFEPERMSCYNCVGIQIRR